MPKISWQQVKQGVRSALWPFPTEPRTQIAVHDKYLLEGIMDLQQAVRCHQVNNTSQIPFCATYFKCGKTVVDAPNYGVIKRVYTIANDKWCDEVFYDSSNYKDVDCFVRHDLTFTEPENAGMTVNPMGFKFAEASADSDCAAGRARSGLWAIDRGRLYVAPWIQSNETLILEWDGAKSDWVDTDMLDDTIWTPTVIAALRTYLWWQHNNRFGDDIQEKIRLESVYDKQVAWIIHLCEESIKQQQVKGCKECQPPAISSAELADDAVPTT